MAEPFKVEIKGSVADWTIGLLKAMDRAKLTALLQAAEFAAGSIRAEIFGGSFRPGTGALARSYTASLLKPKGGKLRSGALSDLVYARIQDEGGTITPKKAKALAIPVSSQARGLHGVGPREFPGNLSLVWPKGRDRGWLEDEQGKVHYSLRQSVRLPGRGYLNEAKKASEKPIAEIMSATIEKDLGDVDAGGE